ncbi:UNKNOWN [Stylonychia lemnae]|uniref:Uncharacterized protein n=1 Tax=Stylonychia lemnae TaxID=5949 RepID=A0A078A3R9_STYLE|nr:UNKNOWN [Stylonychia lemnae]|eukprot:CDW76898.1 UNKNOWN [Stylonychia lemnae]
MTEATQSQTHLSSAGGDPKLKVNTSLQKEYTTASMINSAVQINSAYPKDIPKSGGYSYSLPGSPQHRIIHRTNNGIIYEDQDDFLKKMAKKHEYLQDKGWNAPLGQPYLSLGQFANVAQAFESLKESLPNVSQLNTNTSDIETLRNLRTIKRLYGGDYSNNRKTKFDSHMPAVEKTETVHMYLDDNTIYGGVIGMTRTVDAGRVMNILKDNKDEITRLKFPNSKAYEQERTNNQFKSVHRNHKQHGHHHDKSHSGAGGGYQSGAGVVNISSKIGNDIGHNDNKDPKYFKGMNNRILSPSLKRLIMTETDGNYILKQEIQDSMKRVKAAKKGFGLYAISPRHDPSFFLPNKKDYFTAKNSPLAIRKPSILLDDALSSNRKKKKMVISQDKSRIIQQQQYSTDPLVNRQREPIRALSSKLNDAYLGTITDMAENSTFITNAKLYQTNTIIGGSPKNKINYSNNNSKLNNTTIGMGITNDMRGSPNISITEELMQSLPRSTLLQNSQRAITKNTDYKNYQVDDGMPRIPQRYNELSLKHKHRLSEIVDSKNKKQYQKISEQARKEKQEKKIQKDQVVLSAIDSKPIKPYLKLIHLKDYQYFQLSGKTQQDTKEKKPVNPIDTNNNNEKKPENKSRLNYYTKLEKDLDQQLKNIQETYDNLTRQQQQQQANTITYGKNAQMGTQNLSNTAKKKQLEIHQSSNLVERRRVGIAKRQTMNTLGSISAKFNSNNTINDNLMQSLNESGVGGQVGTNLAIMRPSNRLNINTNELAQKVNFEEETIRKEQMQYLSTYFDEEFLKELYKEKGTFLKLYQLCSNKQDAMLNQQILLSQPNQNKSSRASLGFMNTPTSPRKVDGIKSLGLKQQASSSSNPQETLISSKEEQNQLAIGQLKFLVNLLEEMLNPVQEEMVELDSVYQLKNLIKKFYVRKNEICDDFIDRLDAILIERPYFMQAKKEKFFQSYEQKGLLLGARKIRNVNDEIERIRIECELDRVENFKFISNQGTMMYYDLCQKLVDAKLDQRLPCQYVMDYMKNLLEKGQFFLQGELESVSQFLIEHNSLNEDAKKCLAIIAKELKLSYDKDEPTTMKMHNFTSQLLNNVYPI